MEHEPECYWPTRMLAIGERFEDVCLTCHVIRSAYSRGYDHGYAAHAEWRDHGIVPVHPVAL